MPYTPIKCYLYDYIEIACLRHYTLSIKLLDGSEIRGRADTTKIENKQEFLLVNVKVVADQNQKEEKKEEIPIRLDKIKSITALDKNAEFNTIEIN